MKNIVSSEINMSLVFPDDELYKSYTQELQVLRNKYKNLVRKKYGIWASNQNKFVQIEEELNEFDSKEYI